MVFVGTLKTSPSTGKRRGLCLVFVSTVNFVCVGMRSFCFLWANSLLAESPRVQPDENVEKRLRADVTWLAAPEREGRGPGTKGIRDASEWISRKFDEIGLEPINGLREQSCMMTLAATLPKMQANHAQIIKVAEDGAGEVSVPLELGKTFTPLAVGGSGTFDLPLAFAGYGITALNKNTTTTNHSAKALCPRQ